MPADQRLHLHGPHINSAFHPYPEPDDGDNHAPQSLEEFILDRFTPTLIDCKTGRKVSSLHGRSQREAMAAAIKRQSA